MTKTEIKIKQNKKQKKLIEIKKTNVKMKTENTIQLNLIKLIQSISTIIVLVWTNS